MNLETKLLAMLVHRRTIGAEVARDAIASGAPGRFLVQHGVCTAEQWEQWLRTDGGARPVLSRYELGDALGQGAVGRVFAAVDKIGNQRVAVKVLRPELARDPVQTERFVKEAKLLQELQHSNIVKGLRVAREGEQIFFAMELVAGECLQDVLAERGRLDEETALQIVVDVASALDALHDRGLVHRDVKPGNILWSPERGAVLIDLGFALQQSDQASSSDTTAGTVHYIAPEQARGSGQLDVRADIYALGATLYHLTTGSLPFEGRTSEEVLAKQVLESLSGQRIRALQLSPQLHYFLEKMMAKDPAMRFQNPKQLQVEIRAFLEQRRHQREVEAQMQKQQPRLGDLRARAEERRRRR